MTSLYNKRVKALFQGIGILIFIVILIRIDLSQVLKSFAAIKPYEFLVILLILATFTLVKGLRWRLLVAGQGMTVPVTHSFAIYASGLFLGGITPGKIGDFIKSLYLVNRGFSLGKATFSSLADRLFDLICLVLFGYIGLIFFPGIFKNQILMGTLAVAITFVIIFLLLWKREIILKIIKLLTSLILPSSIAYKTDETVSEILRAFESITKKSLFLTVVMTLIGWGLHFLTFIFFAKVLTIDTSIQVIVVTVSVAIFTALIPVSISGLGTRELVIIFIFNRIGLSREAAVAFSFSFILVILIQSAIGMICWLTGPFNRKYIKDAYREGISD